MPVKINWDKSVKSITAGGNFILPLKEIPLSKIETSLLSTRTSFNVKKIESLKKSMVNQEKIPPILMDRTHNKNFKPYRIFDGHHRYYATLDLLGESGKIMAFVVPPLSKR
jgi:hypothetical protein